MNDANRPLIESATAAEAAEVAPIRVPHMLPFVAVLMCVLFFQGCRPSSIRLTTGPLAPVLRLEYVGDDPLQSEISHFAPHWLALNLIALAAFFFWLPLHSRRVGRLLRSWEFYWAMYLTALFFNSVLFWMVFWQHGVFRPINNIAAAIVWIFGDPTSKGAEEFIVGISSRIYFFFCWAVAFGALVLIKLGFRRYVSTEPERWWQFNLRALLALTFLVGTGLGMALRLINR